MATLIVEIQVIWGEYMRMTFVRMFSLHRRKQVNDWPSWDTTEDNNSLICVYYNTQNSL